MRGHEGPKKPTPKPGMAEMSERFRDGGGELYIGAGGRTHD